MVEVKDPTTLLNPNCFDMGAKLGYGRRILLGSTDNWGEKMYIHHLKVWNGLSELNPLRSGAKAYTDNFRNMLRHVGEGHFDFEQSPIPVNASNKVINGRHRLASAILHQQSVKTVVMPDSSGQEICSYSYLYNKSDTHSAGLDPDVANSMAVEYARYSRKCYIAVVFAQHDVSQIQAGISKFGRMVYWRLVPLEREGGFNLMRELYLDEFWVQDWTSRFSGALEKAKLSLSNNNGVGVYMFECDSLEKVLACKKELRSSFSLGQHSLHINDTQKDTLRIANILFNRNSIHFLNRAFFIQYPIFNTLFRDYRIFTKDRDKEDYCIDGSAVMSAYGLRDCRDLDFLDREGSRCLGPINNHNEEMKHHVVSKDDILYNPSNHFWHSGVKFVALHTLNEMKTKRNEQPKDINDVRLIRRIQ